MTAAAVLDAGKEPDSGMGAAHLSLGRNILRLAFPRGFWPEATDVKRSHHPHHPVAFGSAQLLSASRLLNPPHAPALSLQSYVTSRSQCLTLLFLVTS